MEENINEKEKYRTENHAVEHKSNDIHFRQNILFYLRFHVDSLDIATFSLRPAHAPRLESVDSTGYFEYGVDGRWIVAFWELKELVIPFCKHCFTLKMTNNEFVND